MLIYNDDSETDTDYPSPILRVKDVKIDDNIERLVHNGGFFNYNAWLGNLKDVFIKDQNRFTTGRNRILFTSVNIDNIIYNLYKITV
jgi:hypothetical protein